MPWFTILRLTPDREILEAVCDVLPDPPPAKLAAGARVHVVAHGSWHEWSGETWIFDREATTDEDKAMQMAPEEPE